MQVVSLSRRSRSQAQQGQQQGQSMQTRAGLQSCHEGAAACKGSFLCARGGNKDVLRMYQHGRTTAARHDHGCNSSVPDSQIRGSEQPTASSSMHCSNSSVAHDLTDACMLPCVPAICQLDSASCGCMTWALLHNSDLRPTQSRYSRCSRRVGARAARGQLCLEGVIPWCQGRLTRTCQHGRTREESHTHRCNSQRRYSAHPPTRPVRT